MPNEVTPTQADHALAEAIVSEGRGYAVTLNKGHSTAVAVAAHRLAHEAPLLAENDRRADCIGVLQRKRDELLARNAQLEGALGEVVNATKYAPGYAADAHKIALTALTALATKDTPSKERGT